MAADRSESILPDSGALPPSETSPSSSDQLRDCSMLSAYVLSLTGVSRGDQGPPVLSGCHPARNLLPSWPGAAGSSQTDRAVDHVMSTCRLTGWTKIMPPSPHLTTYNSSSSHAPWGQGKTTNKKTCCCTAVSNRGERETSKSFNQK